MGGGQIGAPIHQTGEIICTFALGIIESCRCSLLGPRSGLLYGTNEGVSIQLKFVGGKQSNEGVSIQSKFVGGKQHRLVRVRGHPRGGENGHNGEVSPFSQD